MKKRKKINDIEPPEKECNDPDCPWHSNLSVRGKVIEGTVVSDRMDKTVLVESQYFKYHPKYERYSREKTRVAAHNPPCVNAKQSDRVRIQECRPLSKTKHFVVLKKL